ncbi:ADOP family duplicated permease [Dokdonella sp.]|uniref:ADOP family duplicated permease n=1 Tax=Dokdonella sp. TaxID=2291710 RepID=UPI001B1ACFA8|nr:ADOP family duplicated permease [Dokdonella sp.]MBO9663913.1 ABC transporter permease [Dokdonella sp.]
MISLQDVRFALRSLRAHAGTMSFATLTLACGLAAALAILAVVDTLLLRALPYPNAGRIVEMKELADDGHAMNFAKPNYDDLVANVSAFEATSFYGAWPDTIGKDSEAMRATVVSSGDGFFKTFGAQPQLGRVYAAGERERVAVISHALWQSLFGGRDDALGARLDVAGEPYSVIGVMPAGFGFPEDAAVWTPYTQTDFGPSRTAHNWKAVGLLRSADALGEARTAANTLATRLKQQYGDQTNAVAFDVVPLAQAIAAPVRTPLLVLAGGSLILLLIAVSNAFNLLLALAAARGREFAVRSALGASRWRLRRQAFLESLLLSAAATVIGLLLAFAAIRVLVQLAGSTLPRAAEIGLSPGTLAAAAGGALLIALVLSFTQTGGGSALAQRLRESGRGQTDGRQHLWTRSGLLVAQTALTTALLVGAGLLTRSFLGLLAVNPGFDLDGAVDVRLSFPGTRDAAQDAAAVRRITTIMEEITHLSGVSTVGGVNALPLTQDGANGAFWDAGVTEINGAMPPQLGYAEFRIATADYFGAAGIRLLRGRSFDSRDRADGEHVAVISEAVARQTWPDRDPIGQRIQYGNMDGDVRPLTVIGVVGDVRESRLERAPTGAVYVNFEQRPKALGDFDLVVRTSVPLGAMLAPLRTLLDRDAADLPHSLRPLAELRVQATQQRRFNLVLLGSFSLVALMLASSGLYGLMAFVVGRRENEFALRQALGASRRSIAQLVLGSGLRTGGLGIALGLVLSLAGTQLLRGLLYGVPTHDPLTLLGVSALLFATILLACLMPARRACAVAPREALA